MLFDVQLLFEFCHLTFLIKDMFYLKYRPKTIEEIDNSRVKDILKKILEGASIPHAILLVGQKGTGKTSTARIIAKSLNCLDNKYSEKNNNFEPCNKCKNCLSIVRSSFTDVVEMDAASNRGIDEIKSLIKETSFLPMSGRMRIFIIDEAHMITPDGFNALLKTLEEPPKSAVFILATTNLEKLPQTIVSRCVKVNFGKASQTDIILMLKRISASEKANFNDQILKVIARHSESSFRDAAKILEEIITQKLNSLESIENFFGLKGKGNLLQIMATKDVTSAFTWVAEFGESGGNFKNLIEDMLESLRLELLKKKGVVIEGSENLSFDTKQLTHLIKLLMEAYPIKINFFKDL
ncbi:MAG: polymerase III gamma subunit protein [Candidatus Roizmanbacteria bacterium GW2011_GWA2_35_19]|uniref:DNA polymerase III subunit gamma/tau n=1 Tax=Candidatus Roizmanbacteria bacterium GW2011_GWA2_35_19 TaxID=1618478 RepID=A0A0G0EQ06_9BACT|nr:MAG: polymerase III gamma subunit protein [Candidatus Roizmanbacteria bacterium GW2011_GWA2_35_19]